MGESYRYHTWADLLAPTTAEVLATYETTAYAGAAAVTRNNVGLGLCTTFGAWGETTLNQAVLAPLLGDLGLEALELPDHLRLSRRGGLCYLFNFADEAEALPEALRGIAERIAEHGVLIVDEDKAAAWNP